MKVHIRFGAPLTYPQVKDPSPFLAGEVTERIWPCVSLQWEWLGGLPPLRTAAVVGAGRMGTAASVILARAGLDVQLGCRTAAQAERLNAERENAGYLPRVPLDGSITISTLADIEFAGVDLVLLAVPCASLPTVMGELGSRVGDRSAVLVTSSGLVPPLGTTPNAYVSERVRARAVATLAGPIDAREAVELGASVVVATHDAGLRRQLRELLEAGGLNAEATDDVAGVEFAACAKNAAALGSAAAAQGGANLAGAAAGRIFSEVHDLAVASGGCSETFAGLAGAALPGAQIEAATQQTAESLATVPLLDLVFERRGIDAPVTSGLARVLQGEAPREHWFESVRLARPSRRKIHAA